MIDKPSQKTTHFGNREVPLDEKATLVRGVFNRVAERYDIMNDAMSFGMHRAWKREMVQALRPRPGMKLLDLAGGTGDIAERVQDAEADTDILLCDINHEMLKEGRDRAIDRNRTKEIHWVCADAEKLPLPDGCMDACTIAFGLRNVTTQQNALEEIHRILKPGGHFLCLEFSPLTNSVFTPVYQWYSDHVIPFLGQKIAGDAAPYTYLVESIRRFPEPEELKENMQRAGFSRVSWKSFSAGVVALHSGWRI